MMVFEQFVPRQYMHELRDVMCSNQFDWYYQENTVLDNQSSTNISFKETPYFQHILYKGDHISSRFELIKPMLYFFEHRTGYRIRNIIRCVANNMTPANANDMGIPHVDTYTTMGDNSKLKTLLYYVNDSDGDTVLFNERWQNKQPLLTIDQRSVPKMGKAIIFDSNIYHCASSPTKDRRVVVNFIFEIA